MRPAGQYLICRTGSDVALIADVVNRQYAAGRGEQTIPGIGGTQQQAAGGGVPVVEMHDLGRESHVLTADERRVCQNQEAAMLIGSVGIDRTAVKACRT